MKALGRCTAAAGLGFVGGDGGRGGGKWEAWGRGGGGKWEPMEAAISLGKAANAVDRDGLPPCRATDSRKTQIGLGGGRGGPQFRVVKAHVRGYPQLHSD